MSKKVCQRSNSVPVSPEGETIVNPTDSQSEVAEGNRVTSASTSDFLSEFGDESQKCAGVPGKQYVFTFNNYKDDDVEYLQDFLDKNCSIYCFKKETGKNGTKHLQGYLNLITKERITGILKKLNRKVWFAKCKSPKKAILYVRKEDTADDGIIYQKGFEQKLEIVKKKTLKVISVLKPWQVEIEKLIQSIPDERSIHWYYSREYNIGKTVFCKYILSKYPGICFASNSKTVDIMYSIASKFEKSENGILDFDGIIFNIPAGDKFNYSVLEPLKDGLMFSAKYESRELIFNSPHVIILSNGPPDMSNEFVRKLDINRWKIFKYNAETELFVKKEINI